MSIETAAVERAVEELERGAHREENARLLFEYFSPRVFRFFRGRRLNEEDVKELVQEVFTRFFTGISDFRNEASLSTWLFTVTTNVWRNWLRDRSTKKRSALLVSLDADDGVRGCVAGEPQATERTALQSLLQEEEAKKIRDAVRQLPPQMRRCVLLHLDQDLPYKKIAAVLRTTEGNVKYQMHEARKRIKRALVDYF